MKIQEILAKWPPNTAATSKWLTELGLSRQLVFKYFKNGWIEKIDKGLYRKAGENVDWSGVVYALQNQLGLSVHPSGYTALDLHGFRHNISVKGKKNIFLLGILRTKLPRWLFKVDLAVEFTFKTSSLLPDGKFLIPKGLRGNYSINISTVERAVLEILEDVDDTASFEEAANVMSGLLKIQAEKMQIVFDQCRSFKVKRLFLFLAKNMSLPVVEKLSYNENDLGKGIIQIVKDGRFDTEFRITIPRQFKEIGKNPF